MIRLNCFFQATASEAEVSPFSGETAFWRKGQRYKDAWGSMSSYNPLPAVLGLGVPSRGTPSCAAVALTEKSRKHAGCIAYDTFQNATRSDVFMICETWADQASLDAHSATLNSPSMLPKSRLADK